MNLNIIKEKAMTLTGRTGLRIRKYSPEILVCVGVVGFVGTVVLAAKATLKVDDVLEVHNENIGKIKGYRADVIQDAKNDEDILEGSYEVKYTKKDYQRDLIVTYTQSSLDIVKLYGPTVIIGALSISCFLGAHKVMRGRNLAAMAAYKAVDETFKEYRKRVIESEGKDADRNYKYGIKKEKITVKEIDPETGKEKKVKKEFEVIPADGLSEYAMLFNDQSSAMWSRTPGGNVLFLKAQENYANQVLHSRGHVFLNEVYDYLGLPHTSAGAIVGWVRENGDDFIDFGAYELNAHEALFDSYKMDTDIVLDFNVDGPIWDLIK